MKRFLWLGSILCVVLAVAIACTGPEEPPADSESSSESVSESESETKKVVDKYDKYKDHESDNSGDGSGDGTGGGSGENTGDGSGDSTGGGSNGSSGDGSGDNTGGTGDGSGNTDASTPSSGSGEHFNWDDLPSYTYTKTALNTSTAGIDMLGERYAESDEFIPCDWTASGIEFTVNLDGGSVTFEISSHDKSNFNTPVGTLFRAYVDGEEWKTTSGGVYYTVVGNGTLTLRGIPAGEHEIRLVKATGYTLSLAEIRSVKYAGTIKTDTAQSDAPYIEFVGDSISCGWGTVGEGGSAYTDQDGTLGYPYLVADGLGADYAITALSGQGLVEGSYKSIFDGYKYASIARDGATEYGFEKKADLVVINVGTNDIWINDTDEATFKAKYKELIDYIKAKNGEDCKILCVYGCMVTDGYTNNLADWVNEWGGSADGLYAAALSGPGTGQHKHPTAAEQAAHAEALLTTVKGLLGIEA